MLNDLKQLGFTPNEINVYESLIKIGETPVGGIINDLKIHRQIVYNALDTLEKRGMISKTMKNKIYHFKINDPEIIVENIQKQELIAKRLASSIKLEMNKTKFDNAIDIYTGKEGLRKAYLEMAKNLPTNGIIYVIQGAVSKYEEALGKEFLKDKFDPIRIKKNILSKLLLSENIRSEFKDFITRLNPKIRQAKYLPYNRIDPIMINVYDNCVMFVSIGKELFAIRIKNKEFYESYLDHFNMLWKIAKK